MGSRRPRRGTRSEDAVVTTFQACAACILLSMPSLLLAAEGTGNLPRCFFAAYLPSWSVTAEQGIDRDVVELPDRIDVVQLAFMRPDASYASDSGFVGTGLEFSYPASVLKDSLALLRARRPDIKVLVSVGGETYANWTELNSTAISE